MRLAAPYQLTPKPEAKDLGFGRYFSDHMLKVQYYKALGGWQKPEIMPFENLSIHPAAKALHYAIQVSDENITIFITLFIYAIYQRDLP